MNKKIIVSMGLPMTIQSVDGKIAIIELNRENFVICKYHPNNSVYLQDANLVNWYPLNWYRKIIYRIRWIIEFKVRA